MYAERGFNDKNQPRVIATALLEIGERQPQSSPRRSQRQSRQPLNAKNGAVVLTGSPAEDGPRRALRPSCRVAQVYGARFYWAHQRQLSARCSLTKA